MGMSSGTKRLSAKEEIKKLKEETSSDIVEILENVHAAPKARLGEAIKLIEETEKTTDRKERECCSSGTLKRIFIGTKPAKQTD